MTDPQRVSTPTSPGEGYVFGDHGTCRSCEAAIVWWTTPVKMMNGKQVGGGVRAPYDPDGTSHFATCPDADSWRKKETPDGDR